MVDDTETAKCYLCPSCTVQLKCLNTLLESYRFRWQKLEFESELKESCVVLGSQEGCFELLFQKPSYNMQY